MADQWYQKALVVWEKYDDEHGMAITYGQLGNLAALQGHFVKSGCWLVRAIIAFTRQQDAYYAKVAVENYLITYCQALPDDQAQLRQIWEESGLGALFSTGQDPPAAAREE